MFFLSCRFRFVSITCLFFSFFFACLLGGFLDVVRAVYSLVCTSSFRLSLHNIHTIRDAHIDGGTDGILVFFSLHLVRSSSTGAATLRVQLRVDHVPFCL